MFALFFHRKEVFRILSSLCDAAMNRLIKGAENSLSASYEMFSKQNTNQTGDLAVNVMNRGGGLLIGSARGDFHTFNEDYQYESYALSPNNTISLPSQPETQAIVRYSHIKIAHVHSLSDLDNQIRQMEFRNVFRLSYTETIVSEETPCYYIIKGGASHSGNLYLSQSFINFCSLGPILNTQTMTTSMLFDSSQDPNLIFTVPYSHIVSVQKQSPGFVKLLSLSFSGYLTITTKNRYEFCLSFSSMKARDRVSDMLLSRIKTVDWNFDDDVIIGGRNGPLNAEKVRKRASFDGSNHILNEILPQKVIKQEILLTGLNFIIPQKNKTPLFLSNDIASVKWAEYFDFYVNPSLY